MTHEVVVLPELVEGGVGTYRDELVALKKELLAEGVDADYLHDQAHRTWRGLKGDVVVQILLGLLTSGAVAAVQSWLTTRFRKSQVRIKVVRVRRSLDGGESSAEWFEAEGNGEAVARALEAIRDDSHTGGPE